MSHYISTTINNEEILLTGGSNFRTIRAMARTGFNVYSLYKASLLDGGMSGNGEVAIVDAATAKEAFLHAVAWVLALQEHFPNKYQEKKDELAEYKRDITSGINIGLFRTAEVVKLSKYKSKYYGDLDEDTIKRSFYLLPAVLDFTYRVFKATQEGFKVEINFC
nr:hypothetical protein [Bacteroidota bacterium]